MAWRTWEYTIGTTVDIYDATHDVSWSDALEDRRKNATEQDLQRDIDWGLPECSVSNADIEKYLNHMGELRWEVIDYEQLGGVRIVFKR